MHLPPELVGAVAAALVGGVIQLARLAFAGVTDARASAIFKKELQGELASFELRLLERLEQDFLRSEHANDRFSAIERAIQNEAAERRKLADRFGGPHGARAAGA